MSAAVVPVMLVDARMVERERAQRRLRFYLERVCWPAIEPATPFVGGFHIDAMCEHLEAVTRRQIRDLLIMVPPRHTKSITCTVAWPTWVWARQPWLRFLCSSFSSALSTEHAVLSRRVIESRKYQLFWSERYKLTGDQNAKTYYENTARGYRISTSVDGTTTGHGGDFLVADDPHNLKTIYSDPERVNVLDWYTRVWSTRFNDPKTGCRVVVMQRGHHRDLAALLTEQGYVVLKLPMEYVPTAFVSPIGWSDPRKMPGELLCQERFGPEQVAQAKTVMGDDYTTQYQQDPKPAGGGLFKTAKMRVIQKSELPAGVAYRECRGWDEAATEQRPGTDPDYTVGVKMRAYDNGVFVVVHVKRGRWEPEDGDAQMRNVVVADGQSCRQRGEQEPGSAGKKLVAAHKKLLVGYDYEAEPATGDKAQRARPFAVQCNAGNVLVLSALWTQAYLDELALFAPGCAHDDQVDASAAAFNDLALSTPQEESKEFKVLW